MESEECIQFLILVIDILFSHVQDYYTLSICIIVTLVVLDKTLSTFCGGFKERNVISILAMLRSYTVVLRSCWIIALQFHGYIRRNVS